MWLLYDVWVNWCDGAVYGYEVYEFHAWRKEDTIKLLDVVPLVKVDKDVFDYIENGMNKLPFSLLHEVYRKAAIRENTERKVLTFAFVVTDGERILAVDTNETEYPMKKSRLVPRQEDLVRDMVENSPYMELEIGEVKEEEKERFVMHPNYAIGLTRREIEMKQSLFMYLWEAMGRGNDKEMKYYYIEWNVRGYEEIKDLSIEEVGDRLFEEIKMGWTEQHEYLLKVVEKADPDVAYLEVSIDD